MEKEEGKECVRERKMQTDLLWPQAVRRALYGLECCRPAMSYLEGKQKGLQSCEFHVF